MTKYTIEEEENNGFLIFLQALLFVIFLPIGVIVLIVKACIYFSEKSREKEIAKSKIKVDKHIELRSLAAMRDQGIITETEFQERKRKIMKGI